MSIEISIRAKFGLLNHFKRDFDEFFNDSLTRYYMQFSDKVAINDRIITKEENFNYRMFGALPDGIKKPLKITVKKECKGFEVLENDFIDIELNECKSLLNELENNPAMYLKPELKKPLDLYINYLEKKQKHPSKKASKQITYQWLGKPDIDLPELYNELINNNLIINDISPDDFKAIFTGQPIKNIKQPIKWHDNNASELLYFITQLMKNLIKHESRIDYKRLKACFIEPNGKPFETDFRTLKTNLTINLSQNKQNVIDRIIDNLT